MPAKPGKKEFRTSVILTEAQFQRVRGLADENDASMAWVLRQAIDRYLEGVDQRIGDARAVRQPRMDEAAPGGGPARRGHRR